MQNLQLPLSPKMRQRSASPLSPIAGTGRVLPSAPSPHRHGGRNPPRTFQLQKHIALAAQPPRHQKTPFPGPARPLKLCPERVFLYPETGWRANHPGRVHSTAHPHSNPRNSSELVSANFTLQLSFQKFY